MGLSKIKSSSKDVVIGYGQSGEPLGKRDDHDDLAIIALESGDKSLLEHFEELPTLAALKKAKADHQIEVAGVAFSNANPTLTNVVADPGAGLDPNGANKQLKAPPSK